MEIRTRLMNLFQDERAFRLQRAMQANTQRTVLPKDQWPTWEEDQLKGRYELLFILSLSPRCGK